jgi:hypothetical protein
MFTLKTVFDFGSLRTFPSIVSNNYYPRISGKVRFSIEDQAFIINNL